MSGQLSGTNRGESSDQTAVIDCRSFVGTNKPSAWPEKRRPSGVGRTVKSVDEVQQICNQAVAMKADAPLEPSSCQPDKTSSGLASQPRDARL